MQRLFYSMNATTSAVGFEEWRFSIRGQLHPGDFRRAWEHLLERHPILRTAFTTAGSTEPLQLVEKTVDLPWREEDLRGRPTEEQEARIRAFAEQERSRGFDLGRRRFSACCSSGSTRTATTCCGRRTICTSTAGPGRSCSPISGRSTPPCGRGRQPSLPTACSYGDYIRWLSSRTVESEAFWRTELAGIEQSDASRSRIVGWRRGRARRRGPHCLAGGRRASADVGPGPAGNAEQRGPSGVGACARPLQRIRGCGLRRRVLRAAARASRHRRADRAVREQHSRPCPDRTSGAGDLARHGNSSPSSPI